MSGLEKAIVLKGVRWAGAAAGSSVAAYVFSHSEIAAGITRACQSFTTPESMSVAFGGAAVALVSLFYSVKDAVKVDDKLVTAAATGSVAAANDHEVRAAVVEAVKTGQLPASAAAARTPGQQAAHARLAL